MAKVVAFTNLGQAWAAGRLAGTEETTGRFVGWGSGSGVATVEDTSLFGEESESRATGSVSVEGSGASAKYVVEGTLIADAAKVITNAGTFTASEAGVLIIHGTFDDISLNEGDTITFTFTINP